MLSTKTECEYLNGWIKKMVRYTKISPEMVNPRDLVGERRRRIRNAKRKGGKGKAGRLRKQVLVSLFSA